MNTRRKIVSLCGAFLLAGIIIGAALVWTLTGAGERGTGIGRSVLDTPNYSFTLSGQTSRVIGPDVYAPLDLVISNTNDSALTVTNLIVTVSAVQAPNATSRFPCTVADFDVKQIDTQFSVHVKAKSKTTLHELGVPRSAWPQVGMPLNTTTNQDGCKGASLTLSFSAMGQVES